MSPLFLAVFACLSLCSVHAQNETILKGITVLRAPFVERDDPTGKLKGYFVDLLDELALIGKFNYTLTDLNLPPMINTGVVESTPNGLINELYRHNAHFAIADYMVVSQSRYVDFTEPYLVSGFSALVAKSRLESNNIHSIEDMFDKNRTKSLVSDESVEGIAMGTIQHTSYTQLSMANDKIGRKVYEWLYHNNNRVDSREQGVKRALEAPYALIQETINNELAMDEHCELTQMLLSQVFPNGTTQGIVLKYGIALQKSMNKHLGTLNQGIKELKANGKLDELRRRYWNRKCNGSHSDKMHYILTLVSLSISLFLLS